MSCAQACLARSQCRSLVDDTLELGDGLYQMQVSPTRSHTMTDAAVDEGPKDFCLVRSRLNAEPIEGGRHGQRGAERVDGSWQQQ